MFTKNIGTVDRWIRLVLGILLLAGYVYNTGASYRWLYLIGIVPLVTAIVASCPLYTVLGLSTCPMKK